MDELLLAEAEQVRNEMVSALQKLYELGVWRESYRNWGSYIESEWRPRIEARHPDPGDTTGMSVAEYLVAVAKSVPDWPWTEAEGPT